MYVTLKLMPFHMSLLMTFGGVAKEQHLKDGIHNNEHLRFQLAETCHIILNYMYTNLLHISKYLPLASTSLMIHYSTHHTHMMGLQYH